MSLFNIISFLTGYVTIVIWGTAPERFINMASSRGIWLWNVKWVSQDRIMVSIRLSGLRPLRHIARETRCRFSIEERNGLPFFISSLSRRKTMVAGAFLFLFSLYMLSSFVWFVDITGNDKVRDNEIRRVARHAGLSPGVLKWHLDTEKVEKRILEDIPEVSWVGVDIKGTRVIVEIAEKTLPPEEVYDGPVNIIAGKDGLVKEILVLQGYPVIREGQTVKKGDILISGKIPPPEIDNQPETEPNEEIELQEQEPKYVQARGIVRARIWYEGYAEVSLVEEGVRRTGNHISRLCMKMGNKEIILTGPDVIPYREYDTSVSIKSLPSWRKINFPIEINTETYFEVQAFRLERSDNEARKMAVEQAIDDARDKISENAIIIGHQAYEINVEQREDVVNEGIVRVKALVETLEEIGKEEPFKP